MINDYFFDAHKRHTNECSDAHVPYFAACLETRYAEWYKAAKGLGLSRADFAAVIESVRASSGRA